jgi:hypothetical protein
MNVLILGGESPRHYQWVRDVAKVLQPRFSSVHFLDYRHWSNGGATDIEYEITAATKLAEGMEEYIIVAKSIGTVIAMLGIGRGLLHPQRCVFMGLPLGAVRRIPDVVPYVAKLPPTTFVQNEHDPLAAATEVATFIDIHGNKDASIVITPGETHDYINFNQIATLAQG